MECSSETLLAPKMRATKALKSNVEELRTCGRKVANSTYRMPEIRHTILPLIDFIFMLACYTGHRA